VRKDIVKYEAYGKVTKVYQMINGFKKGF